MVFNRVLLIFNTLQNSYENLKAKKYQKKKHQINIEVSEKPLVGRKTPCGLF